MGAAEVAPAAAYCQTPLRFIQRGAAAEGRASCGRGYSGNALSGPTWSVQGVDSGAGFGVHVGSAAAGRIAPVSRAITNNVVHQSAVRQLGRGGTG